MNAAESGLFLLLLLALSGIFSMSEAALFSLGEVRLRRLRRLKAARSVEYLLHRPRLLLTTIILANIFVNVLLASTAAAVAIMLWPGLGPWAVTVLTMAVICFAGEILPKTVGVEKADFASRALAPFIRVVYIFVWPLTRLIGLVSDLLTGKQKSKIIGIGPDEVQALLEESSENGVLDEVEREMIARVVELGSRSVKEILTPRTEMFAIPADMSPAEAARTMKEAGYSRAPVLGEDPEDVVGVIFAKDLLINAGAAPDVKSVAREPTFVPESKRIINVFYEFREARNHFALVTDEYGAIAGVVTMDDILAEIIGEVDVKRTSTECIHLGRGTFVVSGGLDLEEFADLLDIDAGDEEAETVAGYVIGNLGRIPAVGERFTVGDVLFQVLEGKPNRVERLWVTDLRR